MMMMMMILILMQLGLLLLLLSVNMSSGFDGGRSVVVLPGRRRGAQVRSLSSLPLLSSSSPLAREGGGEEEGGVRFRCGRSDDEPTIAFTMAKELMNPLGISYKNFVVAEDIQTGDRVGWAQIRPLGSSGTDPSRYNSSPGSIGSSTTTTTTTTTIEDDVDDSILEEFENDTNIEFPNFWSTLPWSKEYRAASKSANERRERREQLVAEEAEKMQLRQPQLWELASVYVIPEKRSEGIGSNLVRSVLEQHRQSFRKGGGDDVYALTLSGTVDWYTKLFGFVEAKVIPKPMEFEVAAGNVITKLMGNELICLRLPFDKIGEEGVEDKR
jgi:N-acetylglutamate synthase-like GNAT family acetyltransferase